VATRIRLAINGTLGDGGAEAWSTGFHLDGDVANEADMSALCTEVFDYFADPLNMTNTHNLISLNGTIDEVVGYQYLGSSPTATIVGGSTSASVAGQGGMDLPPQATVVVSLQTSLRGARYRGRMYLPAIGADMNTDLKWGGTATPTGVAAEFAAFFEFVNTAALAYSAGSVGVYSAAADVVTQVTSVRVGDVMDTQRRRRDNLLEIYSVEPVA